MRHVFGVILVTVFVVCCFSEATSPPVCHYEASDKYLQGSQSHIDYKPDGWCIRQVTCNPKNYKVDFEECKDIPCPADKIFDKESFPDCCCGGGRGGY